MLEIKQRHQKFQQLAQNNQAQKISSKDIQQMRNLIAKQINLIENSSNFESLEQLSQLQQIYDMLIRAIKQAKQQMFTQSKYQQQIEKILLPKNKNSKFQANPIKFKDFRQQKQIISGSLLQNIIHHSNNLKKCSFKQIIDDIKKVQNPINFKKKQIKQNPIIQIKKLQQQNKKLHDMIINQSRQTDQLNQYQKNILKIQKANCQQRIQQLEQEIQSLARDNYKLKQLEKTPQQFSQFQDSLREKDSQLYTPYNIPTKSNDLKKINQKNSRTIPNNPIIVEPNYLSPLNNYPQHFNKPSSFFNIPINLDPIPLNKQQAKLRKNIEQMNLQQVLNSSQYSIDNRLQFDTFQMANSKYNDSIGINSSKQDLYIDSRTSTRNKVAFFKNSLVIVRDNDYQIAFKKSQLDSSLQMLRVIFYIKNKRNVHVPVSIRYTYENEYFNIQVKQKLSVVNAGSQGRQVIYVSLKNNQDLNSVIDVNLTIGYTKYDLWVPTNFINISSQPQKSKIPLQLAQMTVKPDKQFSCFETARSILPLANEGKSNGEVRCFMYGNSKFGGGIIRLSWVEGQLNIQCPQKWLDFIGFVTHHYK